MDNIVQNIKKLSFLKFQKRLPEYKRFLFEKVQRSRSKIVGIYGGRGAGKTTLLLQLAKSMDCNLGKMLYVACDHPLMQGVSLFELIEYFYSKGGQVVIIDEIHESEDFERNLKAVYDFLDIKVFFSGSSAIKLTNPDFARRYAMFHLPILSFREFIELETGLKLKSYILNDIIEQHENIVYEILTILKEYKVLALFDLYLNYGAYPLYFEDRENYLQKLVDTINITLHTDLSSIFQIQADKIDAIKKLLVEICRAKPLEVSIEKLSNLVGLTKATLYKYLDYLQKGELLVLVRHEAKRFKSIRKPDKLYLANPNFFNVLCLNQERGTIRETFFVSQVKHLHTIFYPNRGDFLVDEKYIFEIGGRKKGFGQIKDIEDSFVVADDLEIGSGNKIPLWLFGFLY